MRYFISFSPVYMYYNFSHKLIGISTQLGVTRTLFGLSQGTLQAPGNVQPESSEFKGIGRVQGKRDQDRLGFIPASIQGRVFTDVAYTYAYVLD